MWWVREKRFQFIAQQDLSQPTKKTYTETIIHAFLLQLYHRQHNLKLAESENTSTKK